MELIDITKEAVTISSYTTLADALDLMLTAHTNTLLVTNDAGRLIGEVSVSDLFDGIIPPDYTGDNALTLLADEVAFGTAVRTAADIPVEEFMMTDIDSVYPTSSLIEVATIAVSRGRGRIPVVDHDNRPIGMISRRGLKQILARYLHHPIS